MNLAVDLRMINQSGIGTYLKNVLPGMLDLFSGVTVLGNPEEINTFPWAGQVNILPFTQNIYSPKEQLQYRSIIPQTDVFWSPHYNAPLLPIKAKKRIVTIHDTFHLSPLAQLPLPQKLYASLLIKNAVRKSHHIFTVSEFSKSEIIKYTGAPANKISVVYGGVNTSFYKETGALPPISLPKKYILFVGNVKPHKNLITLLKAYATLPHELQNEYKLLIIGKKEGFITADNTIMGFMETANLTDKVVFTGYVEDKYMPGLYQHATLFVFPSLYEGFGLPVLEALAAGIPVLSSNAASLPEAGGNAVLYFNPYNVPELSAKLAQALLQPHTLPAANSGAATQQLNAFTWQQSILKHKEAFTRLI
jgi:glycosyltransferase involved in cell wall biosynthesis